MSQQTAIIKLYLLVCCFSILFTRNTSGQEILGGEFRYASNGSLITFYVTTYSINEPNIDVLLNYGDGGIGDIEISSTLINDSVYKNTGSKVHIFSLPGLYKVTCLGDDLLSDVRNISPDGNSKFYMEVIVYSGDETYLNTAPSSINNLLDFEMNDDCYITQSRTAIDIDGDSLAYYFELFTLDYDDDTFTNLPEATDSIGIDINTGEFYWRNAIYRDIYGLQYIINEYRDGTYLGSSMQKIITSVNCGVVAVNNYQPLPLSIFPNPVNNNLQIKNITSPINKCVIYDVFGNVVFELLSPLNNNINVDALPSGMYSIFVIENNRVYTSRFMRL